MPVIDPKGIKKGKEKKKSKMCDHIEVNYRCGHRRYLVVAWCEVYAQTGKTCPLNVVSMYVMVFPSLP